MKGKIRIGEKSGIAYIPSEMRNEGFVGGVEFLVNAKTVMLMKPGATLDEVERSLRILIKDVQLRKGKE